MLHLVHLAQSVSLGYRKPFHSGDPIVGGCLASPGWLLLLGEKCSLLHIWRRLLGVSTKLRMVLMEHHWFLVAVAWSVLNVGVAPEIVPAALFVDRAAVEFSAHALAVLVASVVVRSVFGEVVADVVDVVIDPNVVRLNYADQPPGVLCRTSHWIAAAHSSVAPETPHRLEELPRCLLGLL